MSRSVGGCGSNNSRVVRRGNGGSEHFPGGAVLALLLVIAACLAEASPAAGATPRPIARSVELASSSVTSESLQGQVVIDRQTFATTVPSYAMLGENYTVKVVVVSSANITVPIIVQLNAPVDAIFVHPRVVRASVQPDGLVIANFSILPFGAPHRGPSNVTAQLFVFFPDAMTSPALVDQATATVSDIGPSPFPYLGIVLLSTAAVSIVLVAAFYPRVFRRVVARSSG